MAIRTGLVGLVAALSLTLPSSKQIESWKQQAQSWMNARLAEWDAQMPAGENAFVYVAEPILTPVAPAQPAPETATASTESRPSNVAETDPAPWEESAILAFAESELALAIPTEPMPLEEQEIQVANDTVPTPAPIPVNFDDAFHVALTETLASFAAETPAPIAALEDDAVEVIEEPEVDLAMEFRRSTEGLCVLNDLSARPVPTAAAPQAVVAEVPVVDAESPDDFDPIAVFWLEPDSEAVVGQSVSVSTVTETVATTPASASVSDGNPLARAVRLTREAAYAWASLLTGPAVVTPTH